MTEFELLSISHEAVQAQANAATDPDKREYLTKASGILWGRVKAAKRRPVPELVFDLCVPGYVAVGSAGDFERYAHPGHPGLDDAWHILLNGVGGCSYLHALDMVRPCAYPGNTLRGRLVAASDWAEKVECYELARVIKGIKVSKSGDIIYVPLTRLLRAF